MMAGYNKCDKQTRDKSARGPLSWGKAAWQFEGILRVKSFTEWTCHVEERSRSRVTTADGLAHRVSAWRVGLERVMIGCGIASRYKRL